MVRIANPFELEDGNHYCTLPDGRRQGTGAWMGRPNVLPEDRRTAVKLRLCVLPMIGGDYDQGGAYWGCASHKFGRMYISLTPREVSPRVMVFVRAVDRESAKQKIRSLLPNVRFFR